ncbi:MAG TPA: HDIG domain-containing metalloprotein [Oculatellaceae cyanobacterium]
MKLRPLPSKVDELLQQLKAPPRLIAHLTLVHDVAHKLVSAIDGEWPNLEYDRTAVFIGAATHDIGKAIKPEELVAPGKEHEEIGIALLRKSGFAEKHARFAWTHGGEVREPNSSLEDLLVRLADTIWKGIRNETLEKQVCTLLAERKNKEPWEVFIKLDDIICDITESSDERLRWQTQHSTDK